MKKIPIIGITMGEPAGIGPEIVIKSLLRRQCIKAFCPVIIGDKQVLLQKADNLRVQLNIFSIKNIEDINPKAVNLLNLCNVPLEQLSEGKVSAVGGRASIEYIKKGVDLALKNRIHALVTGPINKEAINLAGFHYAGHTELLAELTRTTQYAMMLWGGMVRVVLVTTHLPISKVSSCLTKEKILEKIRLTNRFMTNFSIKAPRIAVTGLNPHAGDGGIFGREEIEYIAPAVKQGRQEGIDVDGPFSADTIFYKHKKGDYDVVIVMYHDQGLIPLKMEAFGHAVNITLGLPIIRTSVDHGTAFDIVGKNIADPSSLIEAIKVAVQLVCRNRNYKLNIKNQRHR